MNQASKEFKEPKVGVIITNLGSPDAPTKKAVKKYLKQFLWDPRVIQPIIPRWLWWCILNGIILNTRPKKSAKLYKEIWDKETNQSPLIKISQQQLLKIKSKLDHPNIVGFELAMRYGNPSISLACENLISKGSNQILVLPLYPQYSQTTTESTIDVLSDLKQRNLLKNYYTINNYHDNPNYIIALKNSILQHWKKQGKPQKTNNFLSRNTKSLL